MATRKSLVIVSGLFQELNTSSDKLDFGGNTTADLTENTNLYHTTARARGAISIASGEGLTYNSSTGVLGTSSIPNAQLANSSVTIGGTAVALGATVTTFTGITALTATTGNVTTLNVGTEDAANSLKLTTSGLTFEGATANAYETTLTATDPTADRTITLPDATGTVALLSSISVTDSGGDGSLAYNNSTGVITYTGPSASEVRAHISVASGSGLTYSSGEIGTNAIPNSQLANSSVTIGGTAVALGATVTTFTGITALTATTGNLTTLNIGTDQAANSLKLAANGVIFEGATADAYETTLTVTDPTADRTITFPNETGTVLTTSTSIANSNLANSSVTIGSTGLALGSTATTIAGLASVTSTAIVTNDSGFRIRDNSDNTKQLAFECSGISGSTTRTLTVQDVNGTISLIAATETLTNKTLTSAVLNGAISGTSIKDEDNMASDSATHLATQQSIKAYVDTKITAEDLDVQTDSGNFDVDLDSEPLILTGGTGIDTSGSGTTATFAIDSTVATLAGSQTLTNKTLTSPTVSGLYLSDASMVFEGTTADAHETTLTVGDPTADRIITLPNATDTLVGLATSDTLTNKTLTSAVLNDAISGTSIKDEDNMSSNSATHLATQQSIKAYVDTKITAEDLDVQSDSGSISIDLDSATLVLAGGTGIDTSATGSTVTYAIDSTVVTLAGSQTLTNKSFTSPTITGTITAGSAVFAGGSPLVFEGATANSYETTLAVTDPTADRTLTLPDETGDIATESFATAIAVALG